MRGTILNIINSIQPFDDIETIHHSAIISWIESGAELFRIEKPSTPPKHLVSYFVLLDPQSKKILLMDHINAELWLPPGGHVEKDEHPGIAAERECMEELNIPADFLYPDPIFLTETITTGKTAGHTDVSLWYVLRGDSEKEIEYDTEEFNGYKWFGYDEILDTDISKLDPHMHRFVRKLTSLI